MLQPVNDLFTGRAHQTRQTKDILVLEFCPQLRNDVWSANFGLLQKAFKHKKLDTLHFKQVTFDLSQCTWLDPHPILALIVAARLLNDEDIPTNFKLPALATEQALPTDLALKFLVTEGFFDQIAQLKGLIYLQERRLSPGQFPEIKKQVAQLSVQLNYSNCTVVKAQVVDCARLFSSRDNIEEWLEDRLDEGKVSLLGKESDNIISDLLYKLRILLYETIENIARHAYGGVKAWGGIYIRFRHGFSNKALSVEEREELKANLDIEVKHTPRLIRQFVEENSGFIEIFVLDNGIGVRASYENKNQHIDFRNAVNQIMAQGVRNDEQEIINTTQKGGLHLVYTLLKQEHDYVCGYSDSQWIGESVPFETAHTYLYKDKAKSGKYFALGLSWIFRLTTNSSTHLNNEDWNSWSRAAGGNPALNGYHDPAFTKNELDEFQVIDKRFDESLFPRKLIPPENKAKNHGKLDAIKILLTQKDITKRGVWDLIDETFADSLPLTAGKDRLLLIADIPEKEALTYTAALMQARIFDPSSSWKAKVSEILLVTEKFYVCALRKVQVDRPDNKPLFTFELNESYGKSYVNAAYYNQSEVPHPARSIRELTNFLKSYDSQIFWKTIANHPLREFLFVNEEIIWGDKGNIIDGYLNFSLTLTQSIFLELFRLGLRRCYGFYADKKAVLRNIDELTGTLCDDFNSNAENIPDQKGQTIYVGSVYGSGGHERDRLAEHPPVNTDLIINFFIQQQENRFQERTALFYWITPKLIKEYQFDRANRRYHRIGKTHTIAEYGWKYFPIPRYKSDKTSFYQRAPEKTYADWQSINNSIISFGNYYYQGFGDLIKIDIKKAVEYSFKYKTELARFLTTEFFHALKDQCTLADEGMVISDESSTDHTFYENVGLIVYPNHLNTAISIQYLKSQFHGSGFEDRVIPIDFTQSYHESNAYLIAPLTLERIKAALKVQKQRGKHDVVFFDCAIVSGRTRAQILHIIEGLGASNTKTLSILDRSRLPLSLPDTTRLRAFWRFDVPRLSVGENNFIDKLLEEITQISPLLTQPAVQRIREWTTSWGSDNIHIYNTGHGIKPSRLTGETRITKKFSVENTYPHDQIGGEKNKIHLVNSLGLVIYCAEAHTMTGKDDLGLQLISEHQLPASITIELISSQLLLFPRDFSRHLKLEMLKQLFRALLTISQPDNHTALGSLVLIGQNENIIKSLLSEMSIEQSLDSAVMNLDLKIAVDYLKYKYRIQDKSERSSYESIFIKDERDNLWMVYKRFHDEIYEGKGKMHSRPILDIYSYAPSEYLVKLNDALVSFSRLEALFTNEIKHWYLRNSNQYFSHASIAKKMQFCYQEAESLLTRKDSEKYQAFRQQVKNEIVDFLKEVHGSIFATVKSDGDPPIRRRFRQLIASLIEPTQSERWKNEATAKKILVPPGEFPIVLISEKIEDFPREFDDYANVWVVFDRRVQDEVQNLIYNAIYSKGAIFDPQNPSDSRKAHMWIYIKYYAENVGIEFLNVTDMSLDTIDPIIRKNQSDAYRHCMNSMGLNCEFAIQNETALEVPNVKIILKLPII